jgi:hypothetical protein
MGTWNAPHTKELKEKLEKKLSELLDLQDEIQNLFGDDQLCDIFMSAEDRITYALEHNWLPPQREDDGFQTFMKEIN